jgi:PAS domain S-box-containing protein
MAARNASTGTKLGLAGRKKGPGRSGSESPARPTVDHARAFELAADPILITDATGRYIDANRTACEFTGYTKEELCRMRVGDLTVEAEKPASQSHWDEVRRKGVSVRTGTLVRKDGRHVFVEARAVALGDGTFQGILRDVSDRVIMEQEMRATTDAFRALVDLCHDAVISGDAEGRITMWNPSAQAIFGYSKEEAIGMPIRALVPPEHRAAHDAAFRRRLQQHGAERFGRTLTVDGLRRDGTRVPLSLSLGVGRQADKLVLTAVARDIAEHQKVVERLNDALQMLQFHIDRMPLGYIVWDGDFRVSEWNPAAERIFGFTKAEVLGRHAYDLIVPPDVIPAVDVIWNDLLKGDTSSHSINDNVRKDGSRLTCEWFNTPLRDPAGRVHGVASMVMDVSERELMESQIRNSQKLESLGVIAGGIAHDFNSSLMVMLGNTGLLRSIKGLPDKARGHIELIEQAGHRAQNLIKHLLAYARTGRHNPQSTDVSAVIRDALTFVRSSIGQRHEVRLELAPELPLILADRSQLEQILLNLCLNAQQSMPQGGTIMVRTQVTTLSRNQALRCVPHDVRPGAYVEMTVVDTGCGMDPATLSRIFDPFFTTKPEGHGLGLAAVLGILRQHQGAAWVESGLGKGTLVHVYLPVTKEEPSLNRNRNSEAKKRPAT